MLPHEIMATEHLRRKPAKIPHPIYNYAFEVEAHQGMQAGFVVYGFICPHCHVAYAVNQIQGENGEPCECLHTCGAYIRFVVPRSRED